MSIAGIQYRILTQDNRCTSEPIWIVQVCRRIYGMDPDYVSDLAWIDEDGDPAGPEEAAELEREYEATGDEPDCWTRTAYIDVWEFVTACMTEAGCQAYIDRNGHNHSGELRIYAHGSYRNEEWRAVRASIRDRPTEAQP